MARKQKRRRRSYGVAGLAAMLSIISKNTTQDRLQKARIRQIDANIQDRQLSVAERRSRIRLNDARIKKLENTTQHTLRFCPKCVELFNPAHTPKCKKCDSKGVKMNVKL